MRLFYCCVVRELDHPPPVNYLLHSENNYSQSGSGFYPDSSSLGEVIARGGLHGECGARAYIGSLRAEPSVGSRGKAPGQGVRGAVPP